MSTNLETSSKVNEQLFLLTYLLTYLFIYLLMVSRRARGVTGSLDQRDAGLDVAENWSDRSRDNKA